MSASVPPRELAQSHIRALSPYTPGFQPQGEGWIKLNTNESPYPPSPDVATAIAGEVDRLHLYPDPVSGRLRQVVAEHNELRPDQVIIGNGSDDVLNLLVRVFGGVGRRTGYTAPGYSLYPVLIALAGGSPTVVEFDRSMELPIEAIKRAETELFFLTSPNAPTGVGFSSESIRSILQGFSGVLVVDEAYVDFADEDATDLLADHPHLVITRTLSKSHGLAGLRVGYGLGSPEVIELLDRVRDSYNLNRLSQAAAIASINDRESLKRNVGRIRETRETSRAFFQDLGWFVYPSVTNFLFAEPRDRSERLGSEVAGELFDFLISRKILVRRFPSHALTSGFLRFSVGAASDMQALHAAVELWLNKE